MTGISFGSPAQHGTEITSPQCGDVGGAGRGCADVAVINHGETDGQMDDRRKEGWKTVIQAEEKRIEEKKRVASGERESVANFDDGDGACLPLDVSA